MKEFAKVAQYKVYYSVIASLIVFMLLGLVWENPRFGEMNTGYLLHTALVVSLSACLIFYPKFEKKVLKTMILFLTYAYFYALFFLYPDTWTNFILLCFIPAISIIFFDPKLFWFSLLFNGLSMAATFCFIALAGMEKQFPHIEQDIVGNGLNFLGSQIVLYFIFHLTLKRMKKQQVYYEKMQQTERLKTTGQLAAAVAHEIRNPLTVVKGFLQLYENDTDCSEQAKKHFALMIGELDAAEHVISQFLSAANPSKSVKLEAVSVKDALESVTGLLNSYGLLQEKEIALKVEGNCYIEANSIEINQLVINLIKNAIEASEAGGVIRVKAEKVKNLVKLTISDDGCGMTQEELKTLGTPFYSLKSKGTGLGLMICYNIVEKYNGTIKFQSIKGKGTSVTLCFPATREHKEATAI